MGMIITTCQSELSSCLHSAERFLDGIHLILPVAQGGRCSYTPSFRAEETEVQRSQRACCLSWMRMAELAFQLPPQEPGPSEAQRLVSPRNSSCCRRFLASRRQGGGARCPPGSLFQAQPLGPAQGSQRPPSSHSCRCPHTLPLSTGTLAPGH